MDRNTFIIMKVFSVRFLHFTTALIGAILLSDVTAHASSAAVSGGAQVTLTASADGTAPFTYQWYKDGNALSGATDSTYTINSFQGSNEGTYTTVISNSAGSTTTDDAVLTLAIANVAPLFTIQPSSQTATAGDAVTFTTAASGTPTPTFQWQKNGATLPGATGASYTLANVAIGDAGSYTVVASNSAGSTTSGTAVLTVNAATVSPSITTQPSGQTVTSGNAATFTVAANGTPTPTYQWKKNGSSISGATGASYTIASTTTGSAGTYTVVVTNSAGSITSTGAVLTIITSPAITTQPTSQTVTAGGSVTFTAAASGTPTPSFQWMKNGNAISGATSSSYSLAIVGTGNAGSYTVVATNAAGSATSSAAVLTVNAATVAPTISSQPASQTVISGSPVTFMVSASGTPTPTYQWKKNGSSISAATSASYTIASTTSGSAGTYTVVVTNSAGSITSTGAVLTINTSPAFTSQPSSQTVIAGSSVTFAAAAGGSPSPTFQWKKNGTSISGATSPSYTISSVTTGNAGSYTVVATNSVGAATSNAATLTVNPTPVAPVFSIQPVDQSVIAGSGVTFIAAASGTPSPAFQWMKDGVAIAGATTASYTISTTATTDAAAYTVVATNSVSSVTSNVATLSVLVAPKNVVVTLTVQ